MRLLPACSLSTLSCFGMLLFALHGNAEERENEAKEIRGKAPILEEVLVSARRRSEDLQKTPVAVSAFSAEDLKAYNVDSIGDITRMTPGLDRYEGRKEANYSIRGIGRGRSTDGTLDPSIGVYIDGIFLARHDSQLLDTVDVESIQVLRGPQGTLFGKNTIGGAIIVTTREPSNEFSAAVSGTLGSFGKSDGQLAMDIPLVQDKLLSRLTIAKRTSDGWARDVDSNRPVGNDNSITVIAQLMANLSDNLQMKLMANYSDQDEQTEPYTCELTNPEGLVATARKPGNPKTYAEACQDSTALIEQDKVNPENYGLSQGTDQLLIGTTFTWDTAYGVLKSITTFNERGASPENNNFDGTDVLQLVNRDIITERLKSQNLISGDTDTRWGWGQEIQFNGELFDSRMNYTVGAFVSRESLDKLVGGQMLTKEGYFGLYTLPGVADAPPGTIFVFGADLGDIRSFDNDSYAVFGQTSIDLSKDVQLTLGTRYTVENRALQSVDWNAANSTPPLYAGIPPVTGSALPFLLLTDAQFDSLEGTVAEYALGETQEAKLQFQNISSMLSLSWDVSERFEINNVSDMMMYITLAQGFKAGGFTTLYGELATFEPEELLSTEFGLKMDLFDKRMRVNMAAYNSAYTEMQMFVVQFDSNFGGDFGTTNAGKSQINGAEIELTYLLGQSLRLSVTSSYNKAEFEEYDDFAVNRITGTSEPIDRSDEPFPFVPEWSHSAALSYTLDTASLGYFDFTWLTTYRDQIFMGQDYKSGLPEFVDASTTSSYSITSLRATWSPLADGALKVSVFGNNIFDKTYTAWGVAIADNTGTNGIIRGAPTSWGMSFDYEFGG